jgi:localization factor PodJL
LKYLQPAAEAVDAAAVYVLDQMYTSGRGIAKDEKAAANLFLKAASLGNPNAQQSLGSTQMLGEGIEEDMVEALKWFIILGNTGNKDAILSAASCRATCSARQATKSENGKIRIPIQTLHPGRRSINAPSLQTFACAVIPILPS